MNHYIKCSGKIILNHIIVQCFAMPVVLFVFGSFLVSGGKVNTGACLAVSLFTSAAYAMSMYSAAYKIGVRDTKSYSEHEPKKYDGVLISLLCAAIGAVMFVLLHWLSKDAESGFVANLLNLFWVSIPKTLLYFVSYFWCFFAFGFNISPALHGVIIILFPVIFSFLGYIAGMKRIDFGFEFFSRLVFKKKKNS